MSHQLNPGLISAYNSLTDKHLAGYFSNTRIRRHLQRAGLITRSGRIVPDKEYRHKQHQRAHQRHVRECLAQAIFHKVLEMERVHQIEIKRKLEEFARRERVLKIKVGRSKRYEEDIHILSPRPPTAARIIRKQNSGPEGEHSESSESPGSSRPNTAPGNMQRPVRLKPINSHNNAALLRHSSPYRLQATSNENDPFNCTMEKKSRRQVSRMDPSNGVSPYCLPVINNFVTPVPPAIRKCERGVTTTTMGTVRGRRLRPTTTSTGVETNEEQTTLRSSVYQRRVTVNMIYFGKTVHLSHDLTDLRDEVKVFQQHCGGENLCVYKGKLREGDMFQFISKRHRGFPFSLTFFLNGLQVERLSSCCEFKHRRGPRLGGRHGHFGFTGIEGASPCYKCIIAMGLDKKPTPPPKRVREDTFLSTRVDMETSRAVVAAVPRSEQEACQVHQTRGTEAPEEHKHADDYAEDFEADDEGPAEETKDERSVSPTSETDRHAEERQASETEEGEREEEIRSRSGSSSAGSDVDDSEAEVTKEERDDDDDDEAKEIIQEENSIAPEDHDQTLSVEATVDKEPDLLDSAGDSTELEVSNTSAGNENALTDDSAGDKEGAAKEEGKSEEEQERAKSVQEKLAEAILQDSRCSSEPELSDTTTEEEEESTRVRQENAEVPQKAAATREDILPVDVSEDQGERSESRNQEDEGEQNRGESPQVVQEEVAHDEIKAEDESMPSGSELKATDQCSEPQQRTPEESTVAGEEVNEESGQGGAAPVEQDADVRKVDESLRSEFIQNNEPPGMDTAEVEMVEVKEEHSELLKSEEEPVTDRRKSEDSTDITVENSSCSSEKSGDTAVEKKAEVSAEGEEKLDDKSHREEDETKTCDAGEGTTNARGKGGDKLEGGEPEQADPHTEPVGEEEMVGKDVKEEDKPEEGVQSEEKVIGEENMLADGSDKRKDVDDKCVQIKDSAEESTAPISRGEEKSADAIDDVAEEKKKDENGNDKEEEQEGHKIETVEGAEREEGKCEDTLVKKETSEDNNVQSEDAGEVAGDDPVPEDKDAGEEAGDEADADAESGERPDKKEKDEGVVCDVITEGKTLEPSNEESQSTKYEGEEHQEERRTMEPNDEERKSYKEGEEHQEERRTMEPNDEECKSYKEGEEHQEERRTMEPNDEERKSNKEGEEHQEERRTMEPNDEERKSYKEGEEHQEERRTMEPNDEERKSNKEGEEHQEERRTMEPNDEERKSNKEGEEHQEERRTMEPNDEERKSNKEGEEHQEERRTMEPNDEERKSNKEGEEHQEERRTMEPNDEEHISNKEGEEHQEERRTIEPNDEERKSNKEGEEHQEERRTMEKNDEERKSKKDEDEENQEEIKTIAPSEEQSETKNAEQEQQEADKLEEDEGDLLHPGDEESKANNGVDTEEGQTNEEENITKGGRTSDSNGLDSRTSQDEVQSRDGKDDVYLAGERREAKPIVQCEEGIRTDLDIEKRKDLSKTEIRDGADESEVDAVLAVYESDLESESNTTSANVSKAKSDCEVEEIKDGPSDQQQSISVAASAAHVIDKSEPDSEKWVELNTSADLEEASKASEEGASVLLQPQVHHKAESPVGHHISEALADENNVDLVSNWVTVHQTSKYFETFVEPMDDLKESQVTRSDVTTRELLRSQSPCKTDKPLAEDMSEGKEEESMVVEKHVDHWATTHEDEEEAKVKNEEVEIFEGSDEKKENCSPFVEGEEKNECGGVTFERVMNVHLGDKPGSVDHERAGSPDEIRGKQQVRENFKDQAEVCQPADERAEEQTSESWMISEEGIVDVTEMPDLTTSKSEFEGQAGDESETKPLNGSVSGDTEQIQNIKSSKEWFSVDDGLFGQSSYPLLAAVRTESRH